MSIQRYVGIEVHEDDDGDMVDYQDHLFELGIAYWTGYNAAKAEGEDH